MPTVIRIIIGLVVVAVVGSLVYLATVRVPDEAGVAPKEVVQSDVESAPQADEEESVQVGVYRQYDSQVLANTDGTRILFFHASWCPQCRALESSIQAGTIPAGVTIFKVDYDSHQELRQRYGVTLQTTLVLLDDQENAVKKYVAYDQPTLEAVIKGLL